jgi:hypothetical protein|nr:MAG TPA: hypothetical protein [Caudoviricetes sp.]
MQIERVFGRKNFQQNISMKSKNKILYSSILSISKSHFQMEIENLKKIISVMLK